MKINALERTVIEWLLADSKLKPIKSTLNFDVLVVNERSFSGVRFLLNFPAPKP